jgi:hypothetical protein
MIKYKLHTLTLQVQRVHDDANDGIISISTGKILVLHNISVSGVYNLCHIQIYHLTFAIHVENWISIPN